MKTCKYLERYRIPTVTLDGEDYVESERCRLGHEIPLAGCIANSPDFETVILVTEENNKGEKGYGESKQETNQSR